MVLSYYVIADTMFNEGSSPTKKKKKKKKNHYSCLVIIYKAQIICGNSLSFLPSFFFFFISCSPNFGSVFWSFNTGSNNFLQIHIYSNIFCEVEFCLSASQKPLIEISELKWLLLCDSYSFKDTNQGELSCPSFARSRAVIYKESNIMTLVCDISPSWKITIHVFYPLAIISLLELLKDLSFW